MTNYRALFLPILIIIFVVFNLTFASGNLVIDENENSHDASTRYRLPKKIIPTSYDLWIRTHPTDADYDGRVRITLRVLEKTDLIMLHADALRIQANASLLNGSGQLTRISCYIHDEETQMLTLKLERMLDPAKYTLEVSFKGHIANDVFGFYASLYEVDGELR